MLNHLASISCCRTLATRPAAAGIRRPRPSRWTTRSCGGALPTGRLALAGRHAQRQALAVLVADAKRQSRAAFPVATSRVRSRRTAGARPRQPVRVPRRGRSSVCDGAGRQRGAACGDLPRYSDAAPAHALARHRTLEFSDRCPPPDGAGDLRRRALGEKLAICPPRSGSNGSPPRAGITEQSPRPRPAALNEAPALPSAGLVREGARPAKLAGRPGPCHGSEHGRARHGPVDAAAAVDAQTRPPLLGPSADGWPTAPTGTLLVPQSLTASAGNAVRSF